MGVHFAVTLTEETNSISRDRGVRKLALSFFKKCIEVASNLSGGDCIIGGVNYAAWGYLTGRSRTDDEWNWAETLWYPIKRFAYKCPFIIIVKIQQNT